MDENENINIPLSDRSVHPYCAETEKEFLSWRVGKRRAAEVGATLVSLSLSVSLTADNYVVCAMEDSIPSSDIFSRNA